MRKKQHKRLNPSNRDYDKFYVINYLEAGKSWKALDVSTQCFVHKSSCSLPFSGGMIFVSVADFLKT